MTMGDQLTRFLRLGLSLCLSLQGQLELINDPLILPSRHKLAVDHPAQDLE